MFTLFRAVPIYLFDFGATRIDRLATQPYRLEMERALKRVREVLLDCHNRISASLTDADCSAFVTHRRHG
jgi:hypothetical protein